MNFLLLAGEGETMYWESSTARWKKGRDISLFSGPKIESRTGSFLFLNEIFLI